MSKADVLDALAGETGAVAVDGDRETWFAVKELERAGQVRVHGRDHDGCGNRWITIQREA